MPWIWRQRLHNAVGWRVAPALAGIVSVIMLARIARRMFRSNLFGGDRRAAARAGRHVARASPGSRSSTSSCSCSSSPGSARSCSTATRCAPGSRGLIADGVDLSGGVPTLGPRPWRLVAGVMFGLRLRGEVDGAVVLRRCS